MDRKEAVKRLYDAYISELKTAKANKVEPLPLHLYSKRVYRAYHHTWKFIDRKYLTCDEIEVMKQLGCYKPSRTEQGTRWPQQPTENQKPVTCT
jgi:retron-type reverse transcriptase